MVNLQQILILAFKKMPSKTALKKEDHCLGRDEFRKLYRAYHGQYSDSELLNMWHHYFDTLREWGSSCNRKGVLGKGIDVFNFLFYYTGKMLLMSDNKVRCRYMELLTWRNLTFELSEDLMVSAFFAMNKGEEDMGKWGFMWEVVIGHDNYHLDKIVEKGVAENHFHTGASVPVFHFSWISLMNDVLNPVFLGEMEQVEREMLYTRARYGADAEEESLPVQYFQAALIRLFLFSIIHGIKIKIGSYIFEQEELESEKMLRLVPIVRWNSQEEIYFDKESVMEWAGEYRDAAFVFALCLQAELGGDPIRRDAGEEELREACRDAWRLIGDSRELSSIVDQLCKLPWDDRILEDYGSRERFPARDLLKKMLCRLPSVDLEKSHLPWDEEYEKKLWEARTWKNLQWFLENEEDLKENNLYIQELINSLRFQTNGENLEDYALLGISGRVKGSYDVLSGERWFLYSALSRIWRNDSGFFVYKKIFYVYLLIKERIRSELVQTDRNVGFRNFQMHENRKDNFIEASIYGQESTRKVIRELFCPFYIKSLELRMSPAEDMRKNMEKIKIYDQILGEDSGTGKKRYFYTFHFIKKEDRELTKDDGVIRCRHESLRKKLWKQAWALLRMREMRPDYAERIHGIDAASNELVCRPEVFAPVFRFLSGHSTVNHEEVTDNKVRQLRMTYHVGEDFLDLADGLRAIDEAVLFLGLRSGDRIGHALALGIDVEEWYRSKNYRILISQQDYLDNLSWIYNRLFKLDVEDVDNLKTWIEKEYKVYFYRIYGQYINRDIKEAILNEAEKYQKRKKAHYRMNSGELNFDIFEYHNAWMLRGDDPELYRDGFFKESDDDNDYGYGIKKNVKFPKNDDIRYRPEAFLLYYYYHYDINVKREGEKRIERNVLPFYVKGIQKLQKIMQRKIAEQGIAIETNPSSNYLIGTFKDFEKHPIINFYNCGLVADEKKIKKCPQISVSINTDDMGIFSTSLKNEYALIACALEKAKDKKGRPIYSRSMIYEWLDNIRNMGIRQTFEEMEADGQIAQTEEDPAFTGGEQ